MFVKLTSRDCIHNLHHFKPGINEDEGDGFYFTDIYEWYKWISYNNRIMYWYWEIGVIDYTKLKNSYRSKKIILLNKRCIWDTLELWKLVMPNYSSYVINPPKEIVLANRPELFRKSMNKYLAVDINVRSSYYFGDIDRDLAFYIINKAGWALYFLDDIYQQDREFVKTAITNHADAFSCAWYFQDDPELRLLAVKKDGRAIRFLTKQHSGIEEWTAVKQNGNAIKFIDRQDKKIIRLAKKTWWCVQYLTKPKAFN